MAKLTKEEKEILNSYERGEWISVKNPKKSISSYRAIAKATLRKKMRVNIRISGKDLEEIQKLALEEGIPYQTLMASILHKYVSNKSFRKAA